MHVDAPHDYYGYQPLVTLEQPIAVAGFAGSRVDQTARLLSILTGLPLFLLDRAVEHQAGCSLGRLVASAGPRGRHTAEASLLPRPLRQRTPPVIALGDTTLLDPGVRWLLRDTRVVYLHQELDEAAARIAVDHASAPSKHWHVLQGASPTPEALRERFEAVHAACMARADVTCPVDGRHPQRVAQDLLKRLDLDG